MSSRPLFLFAMVLTCMAIAVQVAAQPSDSSMVWRLDDLSGETPAPPSAWSTQWGGFNHLVQIRALGPDSVWAVGSNVVHFDGRRWLAVDRRDYPGELYGVDVLPGGTGWAVGDDEEVIPITAGVAGPSVHVPGYRFRDVAVVGENDAWAVARQSFSSAPVILRYRDGEWHPVWISPDNFMNLESIWMASPSEGWAVGSTAVYYNGDSWTEWPLPGEVGMLEVGGTAPDDVWAVGGRYMPFEYPVNLNRRVILHFDGSGWTVERDEPEPGIRALALRAGEGYAVSEAGDVFALRNGRWAELGVKVPIEALPMHTVWAATFVPGAPYALVANYSGWVYRLEDEQVALVHDAAAFQAVAMLSDHLGWVLGRKAMAFDGADWHELPPESELHQATDVAAVAGEEAWAVGEAGLVLRYRADEWEKVGYPDDADLHRVVALEPGVVWVLAESVSTTDAVTESLVLSHSDASGWDVLWRGPGTAGDLAVADGQALVTTSEGIWHFDGASWTLIREAPAVAVGIGPAGELWASDEGEIQEYTDREWVPRVWLPARSTVSAFRMGAQAMWAAANNGFVLAHDGTGWKILRSDPDYNGVAGQHFGLRDIVTAPLPDGRTGIWAVGEPDTIIHSTEAEVLALPAITPPATSEPLPPFDFVRPRAYFPRLDRRPPYRSTACRAAPSAPESDIEKAARDTARYYAAGGPAPEPTLSNLHMLTAAEILDQYGVDLAGVQVGGRRVSEDLCVWWAAFDGWFDPEPSATPGAPDYTWTRLDLALFSDDGLVIYEGFSGKVAEAPPTATPRPTRPPEATPPPE